MAHDEQWLTPRLQTAATLCNQTPAATESPLWLGVDLGTCDVVVAVLAMRRPHFLLVRTRVFPSTCWNLPDWK